MGTNPQPQLRGDDCNEDKAGCKVIAQERGGIVVSDNQRTLKQVPRHTPPNPLTLEFAKTSTKGNEMKTRMGILTLFVQYLLYKFFPLSSVSCHSLRDAASLLFTFSSLHVSQYLVIVFRATCSFFISGHLCFLSILFLLVSWLEEPFARSSIQALLLES
ncbi:hypothetical protein DL96DRAFT_885380 [Flagelloscypha sp. PMI_526]|nr:hypothetical protein DL96DRAFT_885380 [Flagelloscypha sp. PMI_526]